MNNRYTPKASQFVFTPFFTFENKTKGEKWLENEKEIMRQSSVVKEILRKEGIQYIISVLEARFGEVDDTIKNSLALIQDEETLRYLHSQSAVAEKDDIERKNIALSA